jgi:hypothetical protein
MYCPSCGKQISENSNFCLYCGTSIVMKQSPPKDILEWEYQDYVLNWKPGEGGTYYLTKHNTESDIRNFLWNGDQLNFMSGIQVWKDAGWQPVTEVGPAAYSFRLHQGNVIFGWPHLELKEFRVKMRKPKVSSIDKPQK